ncbi:MAG: RNA pseudouridine synthase [Beijerinckiaceae bacterium]|nr:RNA pseudouridine synthase [Beijerinckiaceae bacterium]
MRFNADDLARRVLYRDAAVLVIDKPYGIAVHAGPKGGVTLDVFLPDLRFYAPEKPQLAHRLDRETTGCLVFGRNQKALRRLGALFRDGLVKKTYYAFVCGRPTEAEGVIDLPLARRSHDKRSWWMKVDPAGDASLTRYRTLGQADGLALLALSPETGRTHQLRVHCAAMGWPIAGDRIYGGDRAMAVSPGLMLHAARIEIPFYPGKPALHIEAPLPDPFRQLLESLRMAVPGENA